MIIEETIIFLSLTGIFPSVILIEINSIDQNCITASAVLQITVSTENKNKVRQNFIGYLRQVFGVNQTNMGR